MKIIAFLNKSLPKGVCMAFGQPGPCKLNWVFIIGLSILVIIAINIS